MSQNGALWISDRNTGKMENVVAVGTTCTCNAGCIQRQTIPGSICELCFAKDIPASRAALQKHLENNYNVLNDHYLSAVEMPFLNAAITRGEMFGDAGSVIHAGNMVEIARNNPQTRMAIWTKCPGLYDAYFKNHSKPENLIMIVSSLFVNVVSDAYTRYGWIDGIFTAFTAEYALKNNISINCGNKKCIACRKCYTPGQGLFFINEIVKSEQRRYYKRLAELQSKKG